MPITSINNAELISGHKGRDRWLGSVIAAASLSPITVRLAVKLGIFFNCKTGQCNPGYARLAKEIGISRRSVIRAIAALEADGWIAVDRSDGHHDHKSEFTLLMPGERVTPDVTPTGDKDMSPVQASGRVTKNTGTGDKNRGERVTYAVTTKEPEEPEEPEERGSAARTSLADRQSDNSTATDGPVARTADAALQQPLAEPEQQPPRVNPIGAGPNGAHAGPGFDAVCRSARKLFGAKGDAVAARLLAAFDHDVEEALDHLAVAADEADPMNYLKLEVERTRLHAENPWEDER